MLRIGAYAAALTLILIQCLGQTSISRAQTTAPVPELTSPTQGNGKQASPACSTGFSASIDCSALDEAGLLYRRGDFQGAIAKYGEFLQQNPRSPDAYAGLIRAYLRQNHLEQATQTLAKGLGQLDSPRLRVAQGEVWFRQGKILDAEKELVRIVNSGYPEPRAYFGLWRIWNSVAMYKSAKKMIEKARELDIRDPDIEKAWIDTLTPTQRIKYLQDSLADVNHWSSEEREDVKNYLEYLKKQLEQKNGTCRLVSNVASTESQFVPLDGSSGYGLKVTLNGYDSSLVLDTGASGILVSQSVARRAGIPKILDTKIRGIGDKGFRKAYVGIVDSIKVGDLEFHGCPVEVMESRSVAGASGLIGSDVFEDFLVDINFLDKKFKLTQLPKRPGEVSPKLRLKSEEEDSENSDAVETNGKASTGPEDRYIAPEMQSYARVFRFGHMLLIPTRIGDLPPKLFLLDSGAADNFISLDAAREVTKVRGSATVIKGISGNVSRAYNAKNVDLSFGNVRHPDKDVASFDTKKLSDDVGTEISGILGGFSTFFYLDIKIDYRDALVDFQYDATRWDHSHDPK